MEDLIVSVKQEDGTWVSVSIYHIYENAIRIHLGLEPNKED